MVALDLAVMRCCRFHAVVAVGLVHARPSGLCRLGSRLDPNLERPEEACAHVHQYPCYTFVLCSLSLIP
jgi:hypothetical protein